jgi:aquaporin Z
MLHSPKIQKGIATYCLKSNFFINLTGEGMIFFSKIPALSSSSLLAMNYRARNTNPELLIEVVMFRKLAAEFFGTFWLVFGGCGVQCWQPHSRNWELDLPVSRWHSA